MGFKEWLKSGPKAVTPGAGGAEIRLYSDRVEHGYGKKKEAQPLTGGVRATVESGAEFNRRVTLTRVALIGVFALAAKKKSGGEAYVVVEGPEFSWAVEVERKHRSMAQAFVSAVNNAARKADASA